jgi:hypothetical protein
LHVPAETLWVEWCNEPWQRALQSYGFPLTQDGIQGFGRRGAFLCASRDGRSGLIRTFWTQGNEGDVLASSIEAYFDFDTLQGEAPEPPDQASGAVGQVFDPTQAKDDVLGRCFRFRYERTWSEYYQSAGLTAAQKETIWRHSLGTIAMEVPLLLAFFLLQVTRDGLPQKRQGFDRLNRRRARAGRPLLPDHIAVRAPFFLDHEEPAGAACATMRRASRLHHVRGHLVRRGNKIFWRLPHLRGQARAGVIRSRTVVWTFEPRGKHQPGPGWRQSVSVVSLR